MIKSISYDQSEIIQNILTLHVPSHQIDCDVTYSKGIFYKNTGIPDPEYKFDIKPIAPDVKFGDCRHLPLPNECFNCVMFDPPFLATTGQSLSQGINGNIITKRFGVYPNEHELHKFYTDSISEIYRLLKEKGILIFKCQDKVSSGKQYMSHCYIYNEAIRIGFYPKDLFILLAKNRVTAEWQINNQKNARKFHCYFWVFQKIDRTIKY